MSSLTLQSPTGSTRNTTEWCYQSLYNITDFENPTVNTCANLIRGTVESDFQTFCCDGDIIGLFNEGIQLRSDFTFEDLACWLIRKPQQGGISPILENNGRSLHRDGGSHTIS